MNAPAKTTAQSGKAARRTERLLPPNKFAMAEHLQVQRAIEERAHRFWLAKGCDLKSALNDWLLAEAEVLAEFANHRGSHPVVPPVSKKMPTKTGVAPASAAGNASHVQTATGPALPNLQIQIHKVDGSTTAYVQHDDGFFQTRAAARPVFHTG